MIHLTIESCAQAAAIIHLIEQATELEKLKLEVHRALKNAESIECHIRIMEGERFVSLLTVSSLS